jgi:uncharacterized Tic20 family protein
MGKKAIMINGNLCKINIINKHKMEYQDVTTHFVKKIGYLLLILFFSTGFLLWVYRNDNSGTILGDSSDLMIYLINIAITILYFIYLIVEAISLNKKKLLKLRNVNIVLVSIFFLIVFFICSLFKT